MRLHLPKSARRVAVMAAAAASLVVLGGCSAEQKDEIKRLAEPVGITERSDTMHSLWMWSWLAAMLVGILVWGLIGWACVKYRRRRDDEIPVQTRYNLPIEILYTVAPVIMVLVFFYFTVRVQDVALAEPKGGPDHTVTVVGQQWSWTFNYDKDAGARRQHHGLRRRHAGAEADAVPPGRQERHVPAPLAGRDPRLLGAVVPDEDGRRPRP